MAKRAPLVRWFRRLRRRLDASIDASWMMEAVAWLCAGQIRRWQRQVSWDIRGQEGLAELLDSGQPVILAVWHGRLAMTPSMWRPDWGLICSLTSAARPGRIVGRTLARFGWITVAMHDSRDNRAVSLQVARGIREGMSIGIACDGPTGPAEVMKTVPLDWARLTGAPIWLWTYSVERPRHLNSWDRMLLPRRGGRGVMLYHPWAQSVPKRLSAAEMEALRLQLERDLTDLTRAADQAMGHPR